MKNSTLYWIFGILIILVVLAAMYFVFKSNQNTQSVATATPNLSRTSNVNKNCTQLYNDWQVLLKDLEYYQASGGTSADINERLVKSRNAEIAYNNCLSS